jgi:hypothetical protein
MSDNRYNDEPLTHSLQTKGSEIKNLSLKIYFGKRYRYPYGVRPVLKEFRSISSGKIFFFRNPRIVL